MCLFAGSGPEFVVIYTLALMWFRIPIVKKVPGTVVKELLVAQFLWEIQYLVAISLARGLNPTLPPA